ncbi:repetitive organellar protein-like [Galleria mellonella]|uniref:Repetitive organellar protein-like n=1 Tax=Galleria mellonella TaxID=7137 RepID=A0A6J1X9U2_GALME|nr:repetitive organellar protein-like [Galleria mellonella]
MFSKAKRFEAPVLHKGQSIANGQKKQENEKHKPVKTPISTESTGKSKKNYAKSVDAQSQCSSVQSVKSFITPKPIKSTVSVFSNVKKPFGSSTKSNCNKKDLKLKTQDEIIKSQEVEIRNKDGTISEYNKQIEDLKNKICNLQKQTKELLKHTKVCDNLNVQFSQIALNEEIIPTNGKSELVATDYDIVINNLKQKIYELELQCDRLDLEVSSKQVELSSLEEIIAIRDSLCKDLQEKLTCVETSLEETRHRLEMVKGHHALALEANESIRREYKAELEALKSKAEEEKQSIISKSKIDQESIKVKYNELIESIKNQLLKEKDEAVYELQQQLSTNDCEMKAKLEQVNEATHEKLRLCEIQFEERTRNIQEEWAHQKSKVQYLEKEIKDLKYSLNLAEDRSVILQREINNLKNENELLKIDKLNAMKEVDLIKEDSKKKVMNFENEINKLTVEVDRAAKEKNKYEMSLSVTRDIVQVLTMRLRDTDNELEHLEGKVQSLSNSKELLDNELAKYKNTLNNTILECNEYKEALVNILKSKAALAKEHNRIMEHNVSLIESLQNVEIEAYRELGSIKNELIEDVEMLKKESNTQIQMLRDEVEKKRVLCKLAQEHADQATTAAEQSRSLLAQAAAEITRLESENQRYQQQIQDQQSLVVELSLLRQENEELTISVAKQSSIIDKMKKEMEQMELPKPKSPSVIRKPHKVGKENLQSVLSPLRERNH